MPLSTLPLLASALIPLLAQEAAPAIAPPMPVDEARLQVCLETARTDPSSTILVASQWSGDAVGAERAYAQQCLGMAYTRLLRWEAAEQAFLAAYQATLEHDYALRAKLATMAGNSALADGRQIEALADFSLALEDAQSGGDRIMAGGVQIDRSRALVAIGQVAQAQEALADARVNAPQNAEGWLLSATLNRRLENLGDAQAQIETAAALDPGNPAIGLEAGLIAALTSRDDAARQSWESVIATASDSPEADTARGYLAQLDNLSEESDTP